MTTDNPLDLTVAEIAARSGFDHLALYKVDAKKPNLYVDSVLFSTSQRANAGRTLREMCVTHLYTCIVGGTNDLLHVVAPQRRYIQPGTLTVAMLKGFEASDMAPSLDALVASYNSKAPKIETPKQP